MTKESVTILSVLVNAFLGASKVVVGLLVNSAALLADGIHSITDFISSLGVYVGTKVAKKPIDEKHPYGHFAAETISGLLVVFLLVVSAVWIIYDGLNSVLNKEIVQFGAIGLIIVIISIILNEAMSRLKFYWGKKENSLALIADAEHSRTDAISSVGVLVALIATKYFIFADGVIAILIGGYILKKSYSLGREVVDNLLGMRDAEIEEIIREHCKKKNIALTALRTRKIGAVSSAEITIKLDARLKVEQAETISKTLQSELLAQINNLKYVVVQIESHGAKTSFIRQRPRWGQQMKQIDPLFLGRGRGYKDWELRS
jgi:cation diffusion facilitator family transporter